MAKILICGHFNNWKESFDGQTIKTINIYNEIVKKYGKANVFISDTYFIKKKPFSFFYNLFKNIKKVDNVIILPAQRGVKIIVPFLNFFNKKKKFKIHYVVIGGWLYSLIKDNKYLINEVKKIDYIYAETNKLISLLKKLDLDNMYQMNNFKNLTISNKKYIIDKNIMKCCIFSRIEYLKGIGDAIDVVNAVNLNSDKKIFLDIYGKVKDEYANDFFNLIKGNDYIKYKGVITPNDSVKTIENYNLLLFPTLYFTEGIPGTIIDSYFAGVPVLSSKWESFDDVVIEGVTGISYTFKNISDFEGKLKDILKGNYNLLKMSSECKKFSYNYLPDISLKILYDNIS